MGGRLASGLGVGEGGVRGGEMGVGVGLGEVGVAGRARIQIRRRKSRPGSVVNRAVNSNTRERVAP
jgi:hypothetical protein